MVRRGLCDLLSSEPDIEVVGVLSAIMAGASGYVLRQIRGTDFVDAVRRVAAGQSLLDPAVTQTVLDRVRQSEPRRNGPLGALSDQERRVLELIAEGMTNREIGERLFLAEKTVKKYVSSLLAKLGMQSRVQAAICVVTLRRT